MSCCDEHGSNPQSLTKWDQRPPWWNKVYTSKLQPPHRSPNERTWNKVALSPRRCAHAHVLPDHGDTRATLRSVDQCMWAGPWWTRHFLSAGAMEEKAKREDGNSPKSDRVTLKKEIGLLTACAIIIGEWVLPSYVYHVVCLFFLRRTESNKKRVTMTL